MQMFPTIIIFNNLKAINCKSQMISVIFTVTRTKCIPGIKVSTSIIGLFKYEM